MRGSADEVKRRGKQGKRDVMTEERKQSKEDGGELGEFLRRGQKQ